MIVTIKLIIFMVVSAGIVAFSWQSLSQRRSHGFFRFFVFEGILALILINAERWFRDPFSPCQIVSWLLLLASIYMAAHGFHLLRVIGKPEKGVESTTVLVRRGIYKYVRHPLYSSLLLLTWGIFFKDPSYHGGFLAVVVSALLVFTARAEEAENLQKFGTEYAAYMQTTRMFLPFLI